MFQKADVKSFSTNWKEFNYLSLPSIFIKQFHWGCPPIEHRLFAHVHSAMKGVVFADYSIVKELIEKTTTTTGLKVIVRVVDKNYPIGSKTSKQEVDYKRIKFNDSIPELSYSIAA